MVLAVRFKRKSAYKRGKAVWSRRGNKSSDTSDEVVKRGKRNKAVLERNETKLKKIKHRNPFLRERVLHFKCLIKKCGPDLNLIPLDHRSGPFSLC